MTADEIDRWAIAWIEAQQVPKIQTDHPLWWALDQFMGGGDYEPTPEERWKTILEILHREPPDHVIGMLGENPPSMTGSFRAFTTRGAIISRNSGPSSSAPTTPSWLSIASTRT